MRETCCFAVALPWAGCRPYPYPILPINQYIFLRYLKYYKESKKQFYSTTGGELKVKDTGENYVGFYHIHTNRGVIMEGRFHTSTPHSILIPFKGKKEEQNLQIPTLDREVGTSIRKNISRGSGY